MLSEEFVRIPGQHDTTTHIQLIIHDNAGMVSIHYLVLLSYFYHCVPDSLCYLHATFLRLQFPHAPRRRLSFRLDPRSARAVWSTMKVKALPISPETVACKR